MEAIVNLFQKHISPETLYEYRQAWADFLSLLLDQCVAFDKLNNSTTSVSNSFQTHEAKFVPTGSCVEGANMARMFFEDTKGEVEFDIMDQILEINDRRYLELCDQSNPMFAHFVFKMELNQMDELVKIFGDEFQKFLIYNSNNHEAYLSSNFFKNKGKDSVNEQPQFFKRLAGLTPNTMSSEWNPEDAAGSFSVIFSNDSDYTGTRESDPQKSEKELVNKVLNVAPEFEQQANDELQLLKQIQDNFLDSRLEGKQKGEQISLAIKWSNQSLLLTDILCNHRLETISHYLMQGFGYNTEKNVEDMRTKLKKLFEYYLSVFNTLSHEPDSDKTEKALLGFETYAKSLQALAGFDMFLQQDLIFMETMRFAQRNPGDVNQIPNNILKLSEKFSKMAFDYVLCCKCNFWPEVAAEWPNRKREWPEQSSVKQIVTNGIHFVCKKLLHSDIDWRLSFSVAEIEIIRQWTCWQHYIYFIFKSLFYKYLKPLSNKNIKIITSFLVKTVMLNVSESFAQSWWCKENASECLNVLLMTLLSAFERKSLPHHFVPSFNLLERASFDKETERIIDSAIHTLNSLLLIPEDEVSNLSPTKEIIKEFVNVMNTQKEMMNDYNSFVMQAISFSLNPMHNYDYSKWKKK